MVMGFGPCLTMDIEVRCVGYNVYEARTADGMKAAVEFSPKEATALLANQISPDILLRARLLPVPYLPEEFDSDPEDALEGGY